MLRLPWVGWIGVVYLVLLHVCPAARAEEPDDIFRRGVALYERGNYVEAAAEFESILSPLRLRDVEKIKKARVYRGICLHLIGDEENAEAEFFSVLLLDPEYELDPLFTPPAIIKFFNDIRTRRADELEKLGRGNQKRDPRTGRPIERDPNLPAGGEFLLTLTPFGVGQLYNRQQVKGFVFLGTQVALLVTNISTYLVLKALDIEDGVFPPEVIPVARVLRGVNLGSLGALILVATAGIIDALWYRYVRNEAPEEPTEESSPDGFRPTPKITLELTPAGPTVPETTMGVRLEWRF